MNNIKFLSIFILLFSTPSYSITTKVLLSSKKSYQITPASKSYFIVADQKKSPFQGKLSIEYHSTGIKINNKILKTDRIDISGIRAFAVDNVKYRGAFTIYRDKNSLTLINNVNLEEYLLSVVPSEVYTSWNHETLKAQAVAARTYALYETQRNKSKKFDVYADTRSQVYKGMKSEHPSTTKAVFSTKGQILTYNGQIIKSYFSSSIGGLSASGHEIGDNKPYLKSVKSYHSTQNPNKTWNIQVPLKKIQQQYKTSQIKEISVSSRSSSGRIEQVQIKDNKGKVTKVRGDHFRSAIGNTTMKSTLANVKISSDKLIIKGAGYGHGVGMGQWEAQELAKRGAKYHQILRHFYQGTAIKKLY